MPDDEINAPFDRLIDDHAQDNRLIGDNAEEISSSAPNAMAHANPTERKCVATGVVLPKTALIRFVVSPDQQVIADLAERLPGRGVWVSAKRDALLLARKRNLFQRSFKIADLTFSHDADNWVEHISGQLAKRCLSSVGLARRSGQLVPGFEKIRETLKRDAETKKPQTSGILLIASDAARDGADKLTRLAGHCRTMIVESFDGAALSQATGLENARFILIRGMPVRTANQNFAERFVVEVTKYQALLSSNPAHLQQQATQQVGQNETTQ